MAAPQNTTASTAIDADDVNAWIGRFKDTLNKPETITKPTTGPNSWTNAFFSCFNPIDTCLITCCCPCITFSKTHHRLRKNANLEGFSPVNTTCLSFWLSGCVCIGPILFQLIQKAEVREKYNIQGDFPVDVAKACCCMCCDLIQADKEVEHQISLGNIPVTQEVKPAEGMTYQAPVPPPAPQ